MATPRKPRRAGSTIRPFDAALKELVATHPLEWVRFLGVPADEVEVIDADLSSISTEADRIIRVNAPVSCAVHVEFETGHHGNRMPDRTLRYNVLARDRTEREVLSYVVLLHRGADSRNAITGVLERYRPDGTCYLRFEYGVLRVWELAPEALLTAGLGMLPLVPISAVSDADAPRAVRRMRERIDRESASEEEATKLLAAAYVLMGLRYEAGIADALIEGVTKLRDSTTYQKIYSDGRAEGEARGERKALMLMGRKRLGEPDAVTRAALEKITSQERLEALLLRVTEVESWEELLAS